MKVVIVGAVAGGASAAARLRRMDEHAEIVMFEKGAYVSYANCGLPYYIGDVIRERSKLFVQSAAGFRNRFHIDVRTNTEVLSIDRDNKLVRARNTITWEEYDESYDKLILSPGAEPLRPPLPGIDLPGIFTLRNVPDTDAIKEQANRMKKGKAVVIGGGFIGLEMAENLHNLGHQVTIVEMADQVMAPVDFPVAAIVQQHIRSKGVQLLLSTTVSGFESSGEGVRVKFTNGESEDADIVILSIGVRPDTRLAAEAGLTIGKSKGIWVNEYLQTSDPEIYAVGDAIEFENPITGRPANTFLAGPANKQGRICADNIVLGNKKRYKGSINTAIVKVFDYTVATTGMASKHLKHFEIPHQVSTTRSASHATYYPDAKQMTIQLVFSPEDGRLLGAQVAGMEGVDKRIDLLATMVQQGRTIYDLTELEHAYAPPFSSAKDPVNMAGFTAENLIGGLLKVAYWDDFFDRYINDKNGILVDVRTPQEHVVKTIPGAKNIPLDELRLRLFELPKDKTLYIFCEIGLRGYLAQRILKQHGYANVINLSGGFSLWNITHIEKEIQKKRTKAIY